jgi:FAD/FMN-containing dehydrogenase
MNDLLERLRSEGLEVSEGSGPEDPPVARPADEAELRAALALADEQGARVVPIGNGSRLAWTRPEVGAGQADLLISSARMDRVLDYVPGDGTLTAQAGCNMAQLEQRVAGGGHLLTPLLSRPQERTLGGTLAAGHSGFDRQRRGPLRHHVLGVRVMLADGTAAVSGSKLVKNVTGFDLHRLYTGSRGTLCVLLEASLRLFPAPEASLTAVLEHSSPAPLLERAAQLRRAPIEPLALVVEGDGGHWRLHVTLSGLEAKVEAERAFLPDGATLEQGPAGFDGLRALDESPVSAHLVSAHLVATCRPSQVAAVVEGLQASGVQRLVIQPGVAEVLAWHPELELESPPLRDRRLLVLADVLRERGAHLAARGLPLGAHRTLAPRRGEAPGLGWMFELRAALDGAGRFASPTFPGQP